jgi:hypothetical protein
VPVIQVRMDVTLPPRIGRKVRKRVQP